MATDPQKYDSVKCCVNYANVTKAQSTHITLVWVITMLCMISHVFRKILLSASV